MKTWRVLLAVLGLGAAGPQESGPLGPAEALARLKVPDDLQLDEVLAEPRVTQPVCFDFDERGRLWVVQYIQYPEPAGLKVVSRDVQARIIFDRVPAPPGAPGFVPGKDKITIHEDVDGDGVFEKDSTFVDGLNLLTAVLRGEGGVWVLNPPYLLFYADRDGDDRPDGPPEVHLEGFGLEDTHAMVNSLRWGPDGWIYGAQGSCVTGKVKRPGRPDTEAVSSMGQLAWRYHPGRRVYEIFAEGGGNAFGLEFDGKGRLYSGNNSGDSRGFHYVQGAYYTKGFNEHGALSNPHAYGYFRHMRHHPVKRFTHAFVVYEGGGALPERYRGRILGVSPVLHYVMAADLKPDGSTFKTWDVGPILSSDDKWFAPVDVRVGPDGAVYVADWYDDKLHYYNDYGKIERERGRIYRVRAKGAKPVAPFNLAKKPSAELVALLGHENKWYRQQALRLLAGRKDPTAVPLLKETLTLDALWALHLMGALDEPLALRLLDHVDPHVRAWTARLLCDGGKVSRDVAAKLAERAAKEPDVEVRAQLACSARRLPAVDALPMLRGLVTPDKDAGDPHVPLLLWWALEAKASESPEKTLAFVESTEEFWTQRLSKEHLLGRLARRYASSGRASDLLLCARLFRRAPPELGRTLLEGFERAFEGRPIPPLPEELALAMAPAGGSIILDLRRGDPAAAERALAVVKDESADKLLRRRYVQVLGEVRQPLSVPVLLDRARRDRDPEIRKASLAALQRYDQEEIGREVAEGYAAFSGLLRDAAAALLATRPAWSLALLRRIEAGHAKPADVPAEAVRRMRLHAQAGDLQALLRRHWGDGEGATSEEMRKDIERLARLARSGGGEPFRGKKLFMDRCGRCHTLFEEGGQVGPDLTSFDRNDVDRILLNIVNPNAEVREGFETHLVLTKDGRRLDGFLVEETAQALVLRVPDGQNAILAKEEIERRAVSKSSLMPEGLLKGVSDEEIRDLFAYLRSTQPVPK